MKIASEELKKLISTLNSKERKLFAGHKKGVLPDYLNLFNAYIKHPELDDVAINKRIKIKNFSRVKHYLQKQLLNFISEKSLLTAEREVMNGIVVGRALMERSLFDQALKLLKKTRRFAQKKELYKLVLIIDEILHELESHTADENYFKRYLSEEFKLEFNQLLGNIKNEREANEFLLKRRLFSIKSNALMRSEDSAVELQRVFSIYLRDNENKNLSFEAESKYNIIAAYYHQQLGNNEMAIKFFESCDELYKNRNPNPSENYNGYVVVLHNLMFTYARSYKHDKVREVLDKLEKIKPRTKLHRKAIMQSYINYEAFYCKFAPDYKLRKQKLKLVQKYLIEHEKEVQLQLYLSVAFHLSVNYFIDKDFKKALETIALIDKLESQPFLKDFISVAKIYKLIIYYEMQKTDLLAFAIRNAYRFILKNGLMYRFEKVVINALRQIINTSSQKAQHKIWSETHHELKLLRGDFSLYQVFALFDFSNWIQCKLDKLEYTKLMTG